MLAKRVKCFRRAGARPAPAALRGSFPISGATEPKRIASHSSQVRRCCPGKPCMLVDPGPHVRGVGLEVSASRRADVLKHRSARHHLGPM